MATTADLASHELRLPNTLRGVLLACGQLCPRATLRDAQMTWPQMTCLVYLHAWTSTLFFLFPFDHLDVDCQFQIHDSHWFK